MSPLADNLREVLAELRAAGVTQAVFKADVFELNVAFGPMPVDHAETQPEGDGDADDDPLADLTADPLKDIIRKNYGG